MIARGFKKMFQKYLEFKGHWKGLTSKTDDITSKDENSSKVDINLDVCYGCAIQGHMIKYCQNIKRKNEKKLKAKKGNNKAKVTTWSDSESNESEHS